MIAFFIWIATGLIAAVIIVLPVLHVLHGWTLAVVLWIWLVCMVLLFRPPRESLSIYKSTIKERTR